MRHLLFCSLVGVHLLAGGQAQATPLALETWAGARLAAAQDDVVGLTARYFNNSTLAGKPVLQRLDAAPDFQWGKGAPAPGVNADYFSVRWEGLITAPTTGTYSFFVRPGEHVRLWIGGQEVLNTWENNGSARTTQAFVALAAGERASFKFEYFSEKGDAHVQLQWMPPGQARQAIAASSFAPLEVPAGATPVVASAPAPVVAAPAPASPKPAAERRGKAKPVPAAPVAAAPPTVPVSDDAPPAVAFAGTYTLKARTSGKLLEVLDESRPAHKATTPAGPPQWTIEPAGQDYYRLSVQGGSRVLEVLGSSTSNGAQLELWPYYHGNNQLWQLQPVGDGYYALVAKHSHKALTTREEDKGGLQQWRFTGKEDQQWLLEPVTAVTSAVPAASSAPIAGIGPYDLSISPNPSNGVTQLRYQLPEEKPLGWVLYDARGVVIQTSDYRRRTAGLHQQTLPFASLPTGDYQLHFTVGSVTTTQPVLIRQPQAEPAAATAAQ